MAQAPDWDVTYTGRLYGGDEPRADAMAPGDAATLKLALCP